MSGATLYAFPAAFTAPAQQPKRRGRYPKGVISLTRVRRERAEQRRLEDERQAQATATFRQQVRNAMRTTLADKAESKGAVGLVIGAIDADRNISGWAVGLCCQDMDIARKVIRTFEDI